MLAALKKIQIRVRLIMQKNVQLATMDSISTVCYALKIYVFATMVPKTLANFALTMEPNHVKSATQDFTWIMSCVQLTYAPATMARK